MSVSRHKPSLYSRGLTLIEVMVTLVILLLGLLGLSGLIVKAGRASYEAYERQQALAIANDLAERIRTNRLADAATSANSNIANLYVTAAALGDPASLQTLKKDCAAASCTAAELASYDLATWEGLLIGAAKKNSLGVRVGSIGNGRGCVEGPLLADAQTPANTYRITVAWQGDQPVPVSSDNVNDLRNATACAKGIYLGPGNTADTADEYRRLVVLYVSIN